MSSTHLLKEGNPAAALCQPSCTSPPPSEPRLASALRAALRARRPLAICRLLFAGSADSSADGRPTKVSDRRLLTLRFSVSGQSSDSSLVQWVIFQLEQAFARLTSPVSVRRFPPSAHEPIESDLATLFPGCSVSWLPDPIAADAGQSATLTSIADQAPVAAGQGPATNFLAIAALPCRPRSALSAGGTCFETDPKPIADRRLNRLGLVRSEARRSSRRGPASGSNCYAGALRRWSPAADGRWRTASVRFFASEIS